MYVNEMSRESRAEKRMWTAYDRLSAVLWRAGWWPGVLLSVIYVALTIWFARGGEAALAALYAPAAGATFVLSVYFRGARRRSLVAPRHPRCLARRRLVLAAVAWMAAAFVAAWLGGLWFLSQGAPLWTTLAALTVLWALMALLARSTRSSTSRRD